MIHATTTPGTTARTPLPEQPVPLVAKSFGLTDPGKQRDHNEDQFLIASLARALFIQQASLHGPLVQYTDADGQLYVVADGVGGRPGGAEASALAVGAIEEFLAGTLAWLFALGGQGGREADVLEQLKAALRSADARVCEAGTQDPRLGGMGTTLTMAYTQGGDLFVAHAGDSRCYLLRDERLHQLTQDHTLVGDMVRGGMLTAEGALTHELRHVITNVVGGPKPGVVAEVQKLRLEPADTLLLCSDGLTDMVPDDRILDLLLSSPSPRAACERLIQAANAAGGADNVTAVVARYERRRTPAHAGN